MKMFVITIMENERSVQVADRCVKSGLVFGYKIEKHPAYSPQNCDVYKELDKLGYDKKGFIDFQVPEKFEPTLYLMYGEKIYYYISIILILLIILIRSQVSKLNFIK